MAYISRSAGPAFKSGRRLTSNFDQYIFQAPSGLPKGKSTGGSAFGAGQKVTVGLQPGVQGSASIDVVKRPSAMGGNLIKEFATTKYVSSGTSIIHAPQMVSKIAKPSRTPYTVTIIRGK